MGDIIVNLCKIKRSHYYITLIITGNKPNTRIFSTNEIIEIYNKYNEID